VDFDVCVRVFGTEIGDRETETREIGDRERTRSRSRSAVRPAGSRGSRRASVAPVSEW
jgi:hypothetical protein